VIFNAVGNWPVETVAPADQDAVYIEVWEPYLDFMDLHRLVAGAEKLGGGKPVIIAAYIHPERVANVRLANAIIFASGGYHLELGEPGAMLADAYFPRFGLMDEAMQRSYGARRFCGALRGGPPLIPPVPARSAPTRW
jgi:dextranase